MLDQAIVVDVPASKLAPAAGAVTVAIGVTMANAPLVALADAGPLSVTRTRAAAVAGPVTVQAKLPVFGAADGQRLKLEPSSRLSSTSAIVEAGRFLDQAIACVGTDEQRAPAVGGGDGQRRAH